MGKRKGPNFSGAEPAWKRRRMGAVDRAQQAEIDAIQELFKPEDKYYEHYNDEEGRRLNIFGTASYGIVAGDGPVFLEGLDSISQGVEHYSRIGDVIQLKEISLNFNILWHSHYHFSDVPLLYKDITSQILRVDKLWVKNDKPNSNYTIPRPFETRLAYTNTSNSGLINGRRQFAYGVGPLDPNDPKGREFRWGGHVLIKPPAKVNTAPEKPTGDVSNPVGAHNGFGDVYSQMTQHSIRFKFPKGLKVTYDEVGHCMNTWVPCFYLTWYGEHLGGETPGIVGDHYKTSYIAAPGFGGGAAQLSYHQLIYRFVDP